MLDVMSIYLKKITIAPGSHNQYPHHPKLEHSNQQDHREQTQLQPSSTETFAHAHRPRKTKHLAYTTLVRPILEYASII